MTITKQSELDLQKAINLYEANFNNNLSSAFAKYSPYYVFTNEPLHQLFNYLDLTEYKSCLSVLSGGDMPFLLINAGFNEIDTFDINRLTEYFTLGFKKRAIEVLSYEDFLELFNYNWRAPLKEEYGTNKALEAFVIDNLDEKYKWFWKEYKYALKDKGYDASVFHMGVDYSLNKIRRDEQLTYLNDENEYKSFQKKLINSKITFKQMDVKKIPQKYRDYDLIYISNVLDYYFMLYPDQPREIAIKSCIDLLTEIYSKNLNNNGLLILSAILPHFISSLVWNSTYKGILKKYPVDSDYEFEVHGIKKTRDLTLK